MIELSSQGDEADPHFQRVEATVRIFKTSEVLMQKKISIYLAGKIQKNHESANEFYWSKDDLLSIRRKLVPYNVNFLNPAERTDDLSVQKSVFGRDMLQVLSADFVFVDARDRRGLGVGAEMMWAKVNKIPLISLAPLNTHYHHEQASLLGISINGWIHPFVENLSDFLAETITAGADWIKDHIVNPVKIKDLHDIKEAMIFYKNTQFDRDLPMQKIAKEDHEVRQRINRLER